jgi:IstB-like ATP binding protein
MSAAADVRPALIGHLKDLHLPTVRECYEDTARRAERETLSYEQYLLEVISRECEQRRKSKVQRLLKDSALPLEKSLQNFDLKRLPAKAARQLKTLLDGSFLDRKENVLTEFINTFNHTQFVNPDTSPSATAFSTVTAESQWPRTIQLGLKLIY